MFFPPNMPLGEYLAPLILTTTWSVPSSIHN